MGTLRRDVFEQSSRVHTTGIVVVIHTTASS